MRAKNDNFFFNIKLNKWFFFGLPYEDMTGMQEAYILSMSNEDIASQVANDPSALPGKVFLSKKNGKSYKKLFKIKNVRFLYELETRKIVRCEKEKQADFIYTD